MRKQPQDQPICRMQQVRMGEWPSTGTTPHSFDYPFDYAQGRAQDRLQTNRPSVYLLCRPDSTDPLPRLG